VNKNPSLSKNQLVSLIYHNFFDFPLSEKELVKWVASNSYDLIKPPKADFKQGYYFLSDLKNASQKRIKREEIYKKKLKIASKAAKHLSLIPTIKMVAITGSLAMKNSRKHSDIDLMIITQNGVLWSTRLISIFYLKLFGFSLRKPDDKNEKDKLCLNIWIDENDLMIKKKNIYSAHEVAQIIPLINKDKIYEKFILKNNWVLKYWPNSLKLKKADLSNIEGKLNPLFFLAEKFFRSAQLTYMRPKITNEFITNTQAFFHPLDRGKLMQKELKLQGIYLIENSARKQ
jgi:predicted nucleotidyltransferase